MKKGLKIYTRAAISALPDGGLISRSLAQAAIYLASSFHALLITHPLCKYLDRARGSTQGLRVICIGFKMVSSVYLAIIIV